MQAAMNVMDGVRILISGACARSSLSDTQFTSDKAAKVTMYAVEVTLPSGLQYTLSRRFSAFRELHVKVEGEGVAQGPLPPLPPRRLLVHSSGPDFMQKRLRALHLYMTALLDVPGVRSSMEVSSFLEINAASQVLMCVRQAQSSSRTGTTFGTTVSTVSANEEVLQATTEGQRLDQHPIVMGNMALQPVSKEAMLEARVQELEEALQSFRWGRQRKYTPKPVTSPSRGSSDGQTDGQVSSVPYCSSVEGGQAAGGGGESAWTEADLSSPLPMPKPNGQRREADLNADFSRADASPLAEGGGRSCVSTAMSEDLSSSLADDTSAGAAGGSFGTLEQSTIADVSSDYLSAEENAEPPARIRSPASKESRARKPPLTPKQKPHKRKMVANRNRKSAHPDSRESERSNMRSSFGTQPGLSKIYGAGQCKSSCLTSSDGHSHCTYAFEELNVGLSNIVKVASERVAFAAITSTGDVYTWGLNQDGVLGHGDDKPRESPAAVRPLAALKAVSGRKVKDVCFASSAGAALMNDGSVVTWGTGRFGVLGTSISSGDGRNQGISGDEKPCLPSLVDKLPAVRALASGTSHMCAVATDGKLYGWGKGYNGRIGTPVVDTVYLPRTIPLPCIASEVVCGASFTIVLSTSGTVYSFGRGDCGELGAGDTKDCHSPMQIKALADHSIVQLAAGAKHAVALTADGSLFTWGLGERGQLGIGVFGQTAVPLEVKQFSATVQGSEESRNSADKWTMAESDQNGRSQSCVLTAVQCGEQHCMAIAADATVWVWGSNEFGQLGLANADCVTKAGNEGDQPLPRRVASLPEGEIAQSIHCSANSSLILMAPSLGTFPASPSSPSPLNGKDIPQNHAGTPSSFKTGSFLSNLVSMVSPGTKQHGGKDNDEETALYFEKHVKKNLHTGDKRGRKKTEMLWRKGLPASVRSWLWPMALGNPVGVTPMLFEEIKKRAAQQNDSTLAQDLEQDLPRTFPGLHLYARGGAFYKELRAELEMIATFRPDIGYTQGLSYMGAVLAMFSTDEFASWALFVNLLAQQPLRACYPSNNSMMRVHTDIFLVTLREFNTQSYELILKAGVRTDHGGFLYQWLHTIFAKFLPLSIVVRLWDLFFLDGSSVFHKAAACLTKQLVEQAASSIGMNDIRGDNMTDFYEAFMCLLKQTPYTVKEELLWADMDTCSLPASASNSLKELSHAV